MTYPYGKWRTATKKESKCCNARAKNFADGSDYCPIKIIKIGERYFDTGERGDGPWATLKMCKSCAAKENIEDRQCATIQAQ